MFCAQHTAPDGRLFLVVYDTSLAGKKIDGKITIDFNDPYYQGNDYNQQTLLSLLHHADSIFFIGPEAVQLGKQEHLIDPEHIFYYDAIPFAMMLRFS